MRSLCNPGHWPADTAIFSRVSEMNGTALREKPCEIEGFGYEPLRHSLPEVLGILLTSDESVDG